MQRFGRSAQQRVKDRWGGGFILATIFALLAAWYIGQWLVKGGEGQTASTGNNGGTGTSLSVSAEPKDFTLRFVRVGIFSSPANAMKAVKDMDSAGLSPVAGAHTTEKLIPVYVGPFTDNESAQAALTKVQGLADGYKGAYAVTMSVTYNPTAVPAAAVSGVKDTDMKAGLATLNAYLQEVSMWLGSRGTATVDTAKLVAHGQELGDLATKLGDSKDASVKTFADMAAIAGKHASAVESLSNAHATDADYQAAMADYMGLVKQYTAFQAGK